MNNIYINESIAKLTPPTEKIWATGIPANYMLSISNTAGEILWNLENSQPRITYGITEREWNGEHTNSDFQRNIWVCNWSLNEKTVLTVGLLKWKLNGILTGQNFVISNESFPALSTSWFSTITEEELKSSIQNDDFIENLLNESMLCSKDITVENLWEFKIISCLGKKTYVFLKYWNKYYNLNFQ